MFGIITREYSVHILDQQDEKFVWSNLEEKKKSVLHLDNAPAHRCCGQGKIEGFGRRIVGTFKDLVYSGFHQFHKVEKCSSGKLFELK